jgi:type VI secretion system lysozyme-like protein
MSAYREDIDSDMSVMDRLLVRRASGMIGESDRDAQINSLTRDLDLLLNTRRREVVIADDFSNCASSILNFGVPDLMHCGDLNTPVERDRVCEALERAIETFEPRLRDVSVKLVPCEGRNSHHHFRLEATIVSLSQREVFEMGLQRNTGAMRVKVGDN